MSHNPDQLTIDKVMQGDNQAFAALIERYQHMVFTLALKIVKNREDAEEVAQDVFINAFRAL
jgi:RNA polymerase sigma-70 factor (ECF subfamily)